MIRLAERFSRSSIRTRLFMLVTIILIASFTIVNIQQEKRITSIIQGEALAELIGGLIAEVQAESKRAALAMNNGTPVNTMEQMAQIVQQFVQSTHSVAASAEELNASSEEISTSSANLGQMAEELRKVVGKFKVV